MEIKNTLVISDLDGTLLNSEKDIDLETLKTIKNLKNKGLKFSFATSRPFMIVKRYREMIDVDIPVIVSTGSMLYNFKNNDIVCSDNLNKDVLKVVLENESKQRIVLHSNVGMIMSKSNPRYKQFVKEDNDFNPFVIEEYDLSTIECSQISILAEYTLEDALKKYSMLLKDYNVRIFDTGGAVGIINKGVSKASGIKKLASILNVEEKNIVVFGDNHNDIEMFETFENSIAMGNATNEIKKIAKDVTFDNDHNGIACALKDIFKLKD